MITSLQPVTRWTLIFDAQTMCSVNAAHTLRSIFECLKFFQTIQKIETTCDSWSVVSVSSELLDEAISE